MTKTPICFLHTAHAAIPPLARCFAESAPDLQITNLLDDGILRFLAKGNHAAAERRLAGLVAAARDAYRAELIMVTCSSVTREMIDALRPSAGAPLLKIDDAMAERAVRAGRRLGVLATSPPTVEPTTRLLNRAAADARGAGGTGDPIDS